MIIQYRYTNFLSKSTYSACRTRLVFIIIAWKHCLSMAHSLVAVKAVEKKTKQDSLTDKLITMDTETV